MTREQSFRAGATTYVSDKPCPQGHIGLRRTLNYECVACRREDTKRRRSRKPLQYKRTLASWRDKNAMRVIAQNGKASALRRAPNCVPDTFVLDETLPFYEEMYRRTVDTGILHHVDHIKPLSRGGLHTPSNLQVLTAVENVRKANN